MLVVKLDELRDAELRLRVISEMAKGSVFIYPTDTIYGLGCNALSLEAVEMIRQIKGTGNPFSVIAPSMEWIEENLVVKFPGYLKKMLPGPYTLIMEKKDPAFLKEASPTSTLGVRVPDHDIVTLVGEAGVPFVTTSVNISGYPYTRRIKDTPEEILEGVDVIIDSGPISGKPSRIMDLTGEKPAEIER
jgi:L-threonylcarbamoyladenylate synthase